MGHYGSAGDGGFNAASKAYKANPTLENYLALRRRDPEAEIEVAVVGGFDSMFYMRDEFARFGLDPEWVGGLLDSDPSVISATSLALMESIAEARRLSSEGETHLASRGKTVPDKLIDWIICCTLDGMSWNDELEVSRDLIVLIRERLGGAMPHYEKVGRIREAKSNAGMIAGQLKAQGISPTLKVVSEIMGVAPSTVMRWFEPGELEREADTWSRHFDENGQLRPL